MKDVPRPKVEKLEKGKVYSLHLNMWKQPMFLLYLGTSLDGWHVAMVLNDESEFRHLGDEFTFMECSMARSWLTELR